MKFEEAGFTDEARYLPVDSKSIERLRNKRETASASEQDSLEEINLTNFLPRPPRGSEVRFVSPFRDNLAIFPFICSRKTGEIKILNYSKQKGAYWEN